MPIHPPSPRPGCLASHSGFAGRYGAARGKNVEIPHPVETLHAICVFSFRWMQSFHANGRPGPDDGAVIQRATLNGTTPLISYRYCP